MFGIYAYAQTPYDSFAPEVSHINDNIRKWLSVDPLADKYPNISPYAYCSWNPVKFVDPDGMENPITTHNGERSCVEYISKWEFKKLI